MSEIIKPNQDSAIQERFLPEIGQDIKPQEDVTAPEGLELAGFWKDRIPVFVAPDEETLILVNPDQLSKRQEKKQEVTITDQNSGEYPLTWESFIQETVNYHLQSKCRNTTGFFGDGRFIDISSPSGTGITWINASGIKPFSIYTAQSLL